MTHGAVVSDYRLFRSIGSAPRWHCGFTHHCESENGYERYRASCAYACRERLHVISHNDSSTIQKEHELLAENDRNRGKTRNVRVRHFHRRDDADVESDHHDEKSPLERMIAFQDEHQREGGFENERR